MKTSTKLIQREEVLRIEKEDGIATLWIDNKREKMNVVNPDMIQILGQVFDEIDNDPEIHAVVIISGKKDFMAGADIKSFAIEKEGDFKPYQKMGLDSLERLENSKKPVVAAIHGACFGLGLELSLACHGRIASNHPRTKLGLPEVKVGLLPGGGGTQRLPRLVGIQRALDMILTGKNIYAFPAKKMGLVDELTDKNKLLHAAKVMAKKLLKAPIQRKAKKNFVSKLLENNPIGRNILFKQAAKMALKRSQGNYPAIPAILDTIETGYKKGIQAGYGKELEYFEKLMLTPESGALRQIFFASSANKQNPYPDKIEKITRIGMVGAGFMGAGIAEISVNNGFQVLLKDIHEKTITDAQKTIWKGIQKKVKRRALSPTEGEETIGRLSGHLTYKNFAHVDLVIEAVLEKMELKKSIISQIEEHCDENVIIASNTSSLSVTEMSQHATKPENVIGMHYFSPVPKMPLLEIVKTAHTADWVIASCYDAGIRQGKTCIIVKDSPGFYVNRILAPYMNECLVMIDEGIAFDQIDKALVKKGFPVGPITLFDQVGLDIAAHTVKSSEAIVKDREGFIISRGVSKMFEAGRLGRKNKQGFYHYDKKTGKRKAPDKSAYQFFDGDGSLSLSPAHIQDRAVMLLLNEAARCLEEEIIASSVDGDLGAVFGMGFLPFTGGPFRYMDQLGISKVCQTMNSLSERYGPKFKPTGLLKDMAEKGKTFYT